MKVQIKEVAPGKWAISLVSPVGVEAGRTTYLSLEEAERVARAQHPDMEIVTLSGKQQRTLRGAIALEQRPESVPSYECNPAQKTSNVTKKEDTEMTEKITSDAPRWLLSRKNAFLAALHVLILAVSLAVHPPIEFGAVRTLP